MTCVGSYWLHTERMKPSVNPRVVQWVIAALGSVFVGLSQMEHITWQSVVGLLGGVLLGKALFTRPGDVPLGELVDELQAERVADDPTERPTEPEWPPRRNG